MAGVYVAFPFCQQKCTFCNFPSGVFPPELRRRYVMALLSEIAGHRWEWKPETLYIGGGSPSLMSVEEVKAICRRIPGRPWQEATIEAPPGTVDEAKAGAWVEAGINRVSLGVQSFVAREARAVGRRHDAETVQKEVETLRRAGIANFNIDLVAGLPGQTESSWRSSLEWVGKLGAPHVSVYMLEVDEKSRLGREVLTGGRRYGAAEVPSEDAIVELYEIAVEELKRLGLRQYEISNFALPGWESKHNLKYWRREPYVGFGAGAHSFDGLRRRENVENAEEYVRRLEEGRSPCEAEHRVRSEEERFFLGLRLREGVELRPEEWSCLPPRVAELQELGLLKIEGNRLKLTAKGVLMSNEVFQEFLNYERTFSD